jgi:hypothetical protein
MNTEGSRPVRPSTARAREKERAAARLERELPRRVVLEISPATHQAIKLRTAQKCARNVKAYFLDLLRADGVQVSEPGY